MQSFSSSNLRNDYHFLEDVLQTKDSAKRTAIHCGGLNAGDRKRPHGGRGGGKWNGKRARAGDRGGNDEDVHESVLLPGQRPVQKLDQHTQGVRNFVNGAAASGRNTHVIVMSPGMTKRKNNTSQYRSKADELLWRVHAVFVVRPTDARTDTSLSFDPSLLLRPELEPASDAGISTFSLEGDSSGQSLLVGLALPQVHESVPLHSLLARFLDPLPGNAIQRHTLRSHRHDQRELICLMQVLPPPGGRQGPAFLEIAVDCSLTLRDALQNKTVIEYPTFFFAFPEHVSHLRRLVATSGDGEESPSKRRCDELAFCDTDDKVAGDSEDEEQEQASFFANLREFQDTDVAELRRIAADQP